MEWHTCCDAWFYSRISQPSPIIVGFFFSILNFIQVGIEVKFDLLKYPGIGRFSHDPDWSWELLHSKGPWLATILMAIMEQVTILKYFIYIAHHFHHHLFTVPTSFSICFISSDTPQSVMFLLGLEGWRSLLCKCYPGFASIKNQR